MGSVRYGLIDYIKIVINKNKNKKITVCLHGLDYDNRVLLASIKMLGVDVIKGGIASDKNTFERLCNIFLSFSHIETPVIGSHIVYALALGCTVNVDSDQYCSYKIDEYKSSIYFKNEGWLNNLKSILRQSSREELQQKYPFLFNNEFRDRNWALKELGFENLQKTQYMYDLFLSKSNIKSRVKFILRKAQILLVHIGSN